MGKIFCYELRRLLWNKVFFGVLAVSLAYGYLTLSGTILPGVAHTAPFSPWSFGYYLSQLLPALCLGELFFVSFFTSGQARRAAQLTEATPVKPRAYAFTRCCAVVLGTVLLTAAVIALAGAFFYRLFHRTFLNSWAIPAVLTLLPPLALCLGVGWALSRIHPSMIYGCMALPFLLTALPLPQALSFSLADFFTTYPLTLRSLDPAFTAPPALLAGRLAFLLAPPLILLFSRFAARRSVSQ